MFKGKMIVCPIFWLPRQDT